MRIPAKKMLLNGDHFTNLTSLREAAKKDIFFSGMVTKRGKGPLRKKNFEALFKLF